MALHHDLMDLDRRMDRDAARLAERYRREVSKELELLKRRMRRELSTLPTTRWGRVNRRTSTRGITTRLFTFTGTLQRASDLGMARVSQLTKYGTRGLRLAGFKSTFTPTQTSALVSTVTRRQQEMLEQVRGMVQKVGGIVDRGAKSGQLLGEVIGEAEEVIDELRGKLKGEFRRAAYEYLQGINGTVGTSTYLYSGPIDGRCRRFCLRHVGRTFSRAAIDKLDNGQLPNTFLSRGGYNCRHQWRPVKKSEYSMGELVDPEYRDAIREANKPNGERRTA